mmetsp:Transcript_22504/g.36173  ORF Transcript_22504/g.36173 Transcript_22504/m.36173 type:complete len:147 (-) Transcript_22504:297-737(-)
MTEYLKCRSELERYEFLRQDREQLSTILSDLSLHAVQERYKNVIVFMNFKNEEHNTIRSIAKAYLIDDIQLEQQGSKQTDEGSSKAVDRKRPFLPPENFVDKPEDVLRLLISEDVDWVKGCGFFTKEDGFQGRFFPNQFDAASATI